MTWFMNNWSTVADLTLAHLALALPALVLSGLIAVPIGRLAHRYPSWGGAVLTGASLLYSIPALPMLVLVPAVLGLPLRSAATMIVALTLYGVALLVGSAADAFNAVPSPALEAAIATGHGRCLTFWTVELPLALPVYVAGLRVAAVSTISLVTIGSLVGIHSLGNLLTDGFQRGILEEVAAGIIVTATIALLADASILTLGNVLTPWRRPARRRLRAKSVSA